MTKRCELCSLPARMYCESDQASLCWDCDAKVHGANFLVARHTRSLLCRSCQAPTPWRASGSRLAPTVSVCERCLSAGAEAGACDLEKGDTRSGEVRDVGGGGRTEGEADGMKDLGVEDGSEDDEEDEDEDDEDGDNQVVPWSMESETTTATPPPVASWSSSDDSTAERMAICQGFLKRMRENAQPSSSHWQEELDLGSFPSQSPCLRSASPSATAAVHSVRMTEEYEEATSSHEGSLGPLNGRKREAPSPASRGQRNRDRLPRGAFATVDVLLPSCPTSPI